MAALWGRTISVFWDPSPSGQHDEAEEPQPPGEGGEVGELCVTCAGKRTVTTP